MAGTIEELAYVETQRAIDQQSEMLRNLRSGAGTLLGANSIVIAAMGRFNSIAPSGSYYEFLPLLVMVLSATFCVAILLPGEGLTSRFSASAFFRSLSGTRPPSLSATYQALALYMDGHVGENVARLRQLMGLFQWAACSLLGAVAIWVILLLTGSGSR